MFAGENKRGTQFYCGVIVTFDHAGIRHGWSPSFPATLNLREKFKMAVIVFPFIVFVVVVVFVVVAVVVVVVGGGGSRGLGV